MRATLFLVLCFLALCSAPAAAGELPADVAEVLAQYVRAWESRNPFRLLSLAAPESQQFVDLLDDERFDHLERTVVRLRDTEANPDPAAPERWKVRFQKQQEDVSLNGTVTRGIARIEMVLAPSDQGLRIRSHRVIGFDGEDPGAYRPSDPSTWGEEHPRAERLFHEAVRLATAGDCAAALERLNAVMEEPPAALERERLSYATGVARFDAQVRYYAAVCEHREGRMERARELIGVALDLSPEFPLALSLAAELARQQGELEPALGWWRRSLELYPAQDELAELAESHARALRYYPDPELRGQYLATLTLPPAKAAVRLARLARRSHGEPETRRRLAVAYLESLQPKRAETVLVENQFLFPHDLETEYLLGRAYITLHRLEDATAMLTRVWSRSPGYRDTLVLLSELHASARRYADAADILEEGMALEGETGALHYKLAMCALRQGQSEPARRHLKAAMDLGAPAALRRAILDAYAMAN